MISKPLNHKTFLVVVPLLSSFSSAQFSSTQLGRGNAPLFSLCHKLLLHLAPIATLTKTRCPSIIDVKNPLTIKLFWLWCLYSVPSALLNSAQLNWGGAMHHFSLSVTSCRSICTNLRSEARRTRLMILACQLLCKELNFIK